MSRRLTHVVESSLHHFSTNFEQKRPVWADFSDLACTVFWRFIENKAQNRPFSSILGPFWPFLGLFGPILGVFRRFEEDLSRFEEDATGLKKIWLVRAINHTSMRQIIRLHGREIRA